jgi:adenine-specific DNA-methyltransferase
VLAIFPKCLDADVAKVAEVLNSIDWHSLGFVIDGRFVFSQRSLENCPLDAAAARALESLLGAPETTPDLFSF